MKNKADKNFKDTISWDEKAKINPLFAIMSDDKFLSSDTEPSNEELAFFYEKGRTIWDRHLQPVISFFKDPSQIKVLEYGCGMGRLLRIPASMGASCFGVDISESQLKLAKKYTFPTGGPVLKVVKPQTKIDLPDNSIDFVYSYAVLQHILNTSDFLFAVDEMIRLTSRGGIMKIQLRAPGSFGKKAKVFTVKNISFEQTTLLFYLRRFGMLHLPVVRLANHTHWGGAGCYYDVNRLLKRLAEKGMDLLSIEFETSGNLLWLTLTKTNQ